jgi:hypothetical protein
MFLVEPGFLQLGQNLGSCQLLFNLIIIINFSPSFTRPYAARYVLGSNLGQRESWDDSSLSKCAEEKAGIYRKLIRLTCE